MLFIQLNPIWQNRKREKRKKKILYYWIHNPTHKFAFVSAFVRGFCVFFIKLIPIFWFGRYWLRSSDDCGVREAIQQKNFFFQEVNQQKQPILFIRGRRRKNEW